MALRGILFITLLAGAIAPSHPAIAEEALSLSSAVEAALKGNRELASAKFVIAEAKGRLLQAGLWPNPELEASTVSDWAFNRDGESVAEVGISQRFPIAGRIARAKAVARTDVELAELEVQNAERLLKADVSSTFRELFIAQRRLTFLRALGSAVEETLRVTERRFAAAEVSEADVNLQKLELERLQIDASTVEINNQRLAAELSLLLGRDPKETFTLAGSMDSRLDEPGIRQALETAVDRRPDRGIALRQVERARRSIGLARAERFEDWSLGVGYSREKSVFDEPGLGDADNLMGVRLSVPLPLWNRNQGTIAEAVAGEGKAQAALRATDLKIQTEIEIAERRLRGLLPILKRYERDSLPVAEKNVRLLRRSYGDGLTDINSVLQAQRQLIELQTSYLESLVEFKAALTALESATAATTPFE
jgi:cobalt-zinc-cadmium efflux system outer membrane protein